MADLASEIDAYLKRLFPICRSITGNGNRETLRILQEIVPLTIHEVASGTQVYDWTIPDEWNIRDAWIATAEGRRIVDFKVSNLHVVSYSQPVEGQFTWEELRPHLHTHPDLLNAIPYRTSYYKRDWGFCLTHGQYQELEQNGGPFEVAVDGTLAPGSLTYGELLLPGESTQEILISCYICHPSMANDSLSGVLLTAFLARELHRRQRSHYSYRIVWVPETIGAVAYCAMHEATIKRIDCGLVVTCVGGPGPFGYKQSFEADHRINAIIETVLREAGEFITYPFDIHGSDERQYSSQGFRINVASLTKDKYYEYPSYHTSLDDLAFVHAEHIARSLELHMNVIARLEEEEIYRSRYNHCEIMLSKHDLYPQTGGGQLPVIGGHDELDLILWLLFLFDGKHSAQQVAKKLEVPVSSLLPVIEKLRSKGLLKKL